MTDVSTENVILSDRAASRIARILASEPGGTALRISVSGGGCSGFQYGFDLDKTRTDDDLVIQREGAVVLIDSVSLPYMSGSVIDFVDDLIGQSFQIRESSRNRLLRLRNKLFHLRPTVAGRKSGSTPKPTAARKSRTQNAKTGRAKRSGGRSSSSKAASAAASTVKPRKSAKASAGKGAARPAPASRASKSPKTASKRAKTGKAENRIAPVAPLKARPKPSSPTKAPVRSARKAATRGEFAVDRLHQVALLASDLDTAVDFYREVLGLSFIDRFDPPGLAFFNLGGGLRLLLSATASEATLYFMVDDIDAAVRTLAGRGVSFLQKPAMVHRDDEGRLGKKGIEEWMAFFRDPSGNLLALVTQR